jgi:hypothetical protein
MLERMQKAIDELDGMSERVDQESAHSRADDILCEYLDATGCGALADAYRRAQRRVGFWYA